MTLLRLALATGILLLPGAVVARSLGLRGASATLAWSLVILFGALAVTGGHVGRSLITGCLAFALVLTALVLLIGRARFAAFAARYETRIAPRRIPLTIAAGALLGILVTLTSVGAGALGAVILIMLHPSMPVARIAGVDIAHAVPLTLVAGLGHVWLGTVDFSLAANLLAGSVPGIVAGSLLAGRLPEALVRRLLAFVLLYAGVRLALASL